MLYSEHMNKKTTPTSLKFEGQIKINSKSTGFVFNEETDDFVEIEPAFLT